METLIVILLVVIILLQVATLRRQSISHVRLGEGMIALGDLIRRRNP